MDEDTRQPKDVFHTITSDDWRRSIANARLRKNKAWEQIKAKIDEFKAAKALGQPGGSKATPHAEGPRDPPHETEAGRWTHGNHPTNLPP